MILKDFREFFKNSLSEIYPATEIDSFFFLLIEEYLGLQRIDTVLKPNLLIDEKQLLILQNALLRLQKEEPIQYIIGTTEFFGYPFFVDKSTLIPRPETEELVAWIIEDVANFDKNSNTIQILDIGTGSGCIPISLAKKLNSVHISAIDVSKKALNIAKRNAALNQVNVNFIAADILKITNLNTLQNQSKKDEIKVDLSTQKNAEKNTVINNCKYDILVSNPPYVRELEKPEIKKNVLQNEPHLALFVSNKNPLLFYDKIADLAKHNLAKNGALYFEINQYLSYETKQLLENKGFRNIELRKDIFGNFRMIKAKL